MALGTGHQVLEQGLHGGPVRPLLDHPPQAIDDPEELLMLFVDELDPRVVARVPDRFHDLDTPFPSEVSQGPGTSSVQSIDRANAAS